MVPFCTMAVLHAVHTSQMEVWHSPGFPSGKSLKKKPACSTLFFTIHVTLGFSLTLWRKLQFNITINLKTDITQYLQVFCHVQGIYSGSPLSPLGQHTMDSLRKLSWKSWKQPTSILHMYIHVHWFYICCTVLSKLLHLKFWLTIYWQENKGRHKAKLILTSMIGNKRLIGTAILSAYYKRMKRRRNWKYHLPHSEILCLTLVHSMYS